jgi:6-pyruvoyl-tetrahydropterin synthase
MKSVKKQVWDNVDHQVLIDIEDQVERHVDMQVYRLILRPVMLMFQSDMRVYDKVLDRARTEP